MKPYLAMLVFAIVVGTGCAALADPAPTRGKDTDPSGAYQPPDTPLGSGPYKAIMAEDPSLSDHTLYYPAEIGAAGKLPIILWANGGCTNIGNRFRYFLTEIASHGFLVAAGGPISAKRYEMWPQQGPPPGSPPAGVPLTATQYAEVRGGNTIEQMLATLDWAAKANADPSSKFYRRLDLSQIAVAGQSCGGSLAAGFAGDPRVKTTALFSGAPFLKPQPNIQPNPTDDVAHLKRIHGPVLMLSGDAGDINHAATADVAAVITQAPVFYAWQDGLAHSGTYGMPNGGELGRLAWQWFAWRLRGDQAAGKTFIGADCGLCKEKGDGWNVVKFISATGGYRPN